MTLKRAFDVAGSCALDEINVPEVGTVLERTGGVRDPALVILLTGNAAVLSRRDGRPAPIPRLLRSE